MWTLLALACTPDVRSMYEQEREAALTVASERPADWQPDLTVQIAGPDFELAVSTALKAALAKDQAALVLPIGLGLEAKLKPVFSVEEANLRPSDTCASCLAFDAVIVGKAAWSLGPAGGTIPLDVGAQGVFALEVADGHIIEAIPRAVTSVRVRVTDLGALKVNPSKEIQEWLTEQLSARIPKIRVVDLDTSTLPLRDLRLRGEGTGIRIEALTNVPGSKPIGAVDAPTTGVRVAVSESALAGLARRAAYQKGELAMEVYADPLEMHIEGSEFTLDLRLYRLVGRGWWRDYRVFGKVEIKNGKVKMTASRVDPLGASPGAGLVDPLAALFEGKILEAITDSVAQSFPASQSQDLGVVQLKAETNAVTGRNNTLIADGALIVRAPEEKGGNKPDRQRNK